MSVALFAISLKQMQLRSIYMDTAPAFLFGTPFGHGRPDGGDVDVVSILRVASRVLSSTTHRTLLETIRQSDAFTSIPFRGVAIQLESATSPQKKCGDITFLGNIVSRK